MRVVAIACGCGDYVTEDPNDAHFDYPGHDPQDNETVGWNAFNEAKAEDEAPKEEVAETPKMCEAFVTVGSRKVTCRNPHNFPGELHRAFINDDITGKVVSLEWQ